MATAEASGFIASTGHDLPFSLTLHPIHPPSCCLCAISEVSEDIPKQADKLQSWQDHYNENPFHGQPEESSETSLPPEFVYASVETEACLHSEEEITCSINIEDSSTTSLSSNDSFGEFPSSESDSLPSKDGPTSLPEPCNADSESSLKEACTNYSLNTNALSIEVAALPPDRILKSLDCVASPLDESDPISFDSLNDNEFPLIFSSEKVALEQIKDNARSIPNAGIKALCAETEDTDIEQDKNFEHLSHDHNLQNDSNKEILDSELNDSLPTKKYDIDKEDTKARSALPVNEEAILEEDINIHVVNLSQQLEQEPEDDSSHDASYPCTSLSSFVDKGDHDDSTENSSIDILVDNNTKDVDHKSAADSVDIILNDGAVLPTVELHTHEDKVILAPDVLLDEHLLSEIPYIEDACDEVDFVVDQPLTNKNNVDIEKNTDNRKTTATNCNQIDLDLHSDSLEPNQNNPQESCNLIVSVGSDKGEYISTEVIKIDQQNDHDDNEFDDEVCENSQRKHKNLFLGVNEGGLIADNAEEKTENDHIATAPKSLAAINGEQDQESAESNLDELSQTCVSHVDDIPEADFKALYDRCTELENEQTDSPSTDSELDIFRSLPCGNLSLEREILSNFDDNSSEPKIQSQSYQIIASNCTALSCGEKVESAVTVSDSSQENLKNKQSPQEKPHCDPEYLTSEYIINEGNLYNNGTAKDVDRASHPISHRMEDDGACQNEINEMLINTSLASPCDELTAFSNSEVQMSCSLSVEKVEKSESSNYFKCIESSLSSHYQERDRNISYSNYEEIPTLFGNVKDEFLNSNDCRGEILICDPADNSCGNLDREITESLSDQTNNSVEETLFGKFLPTITEEREDLSIISVRSVSESNVSNISTCQHESKEGHPTAYFNKKLRASLSNPDFFFSNDPSTCSVQGNSDCGYKLIVGDVVRNIPAIVMLMQEKDEMEEPHGERVQDYFKTQEIVMMNDDESFVTVVQDSFSENSTQQEGASPVDEEEIIPHFENLVQHGINMERFVERRSSEGMFTDIFTPSDNFPTTKKSMTIDKRFRRRFSMIIGRGLSKFMKSDEDNKHGGKPSMERYGSCESLFSKGSRQESEAGENTASEVSDVISVSYNSPKLRRSNATKKKRKSFKSVQSDPPPCFKESDSEIKDSKDSSCTSLQDLQNHKRDSFGKRSHGSGRRPNEGLILEPSGTIAIDYPHVELIHPGQRPSVSPRTLNNFLALEHSDIPLKGARGSCPHNSSSPPPPVPTHTHPLSNDVSTHHYGSTTTTTSTHHPQLALHHHHHHHHLHDSCIPDLLRGSRSRGSVGSSVRDGSDTSSAYSGSDTMCQSLHSLDHEDVDLSGLMESVVDSDEEDLAESVESLSVRDAVRECLEKDPSERTEDDVKVLLEFTERLSAFSNMTVAVRRAMCQSMVFAVVDEAGTILMNDQEELDSWSVIINGHVEVTHPTGGTVEELHLGDSFGITPTMEKLYHIGVMRSKVPDCQFVCIRQSDYYRILHQGEENTKRIEEDGVLVLVTEQRHIEACDRKGHIVIKGTPERLMQQLVEVANELDPTYVEDFLLTHRTFIENPLILANKLLEWFKDPRHQDHVTRVILRWVQSHFTDFETDPYMMNFLEDFEEGLERKNMTGQLLLLRVACMTKARNRLVTLTRPSRDDHLQFKFIGDKDGIFILSVEKGSKAEEVGLKRADQILEVNSHSFNKITKTKAHEILTQTCHLAITVKSNLHAFNELLKEPEHSHRSKNWMTSELTGNGACHGASDFMSTLNLNTNPHLHNNKKGEKLMSMTLKAHKLKERFFPTIGNKNSIVDTPSDDSISSHSSLGGPLYRSRSNPDLSTSGYEDGSRSEFPDHVLKVYRATDHSTRFIPLHKETTAREVVMLSLPLFNITAEPSHNYALFEVSVTEQGVVKQKRLSPDLKNLAERIGLSSRYYLRSVASSQNLCPDEVITELIRESQVNILQLNSVELATQLTLEDFIVFRQIEPTEYIDNLFKLKSSYGTPALSNFEDISNKELFWVCTEVCTEQNLVKRAKIIKQFIKIAKHCKDVKNFNSMFAIISGLGSGCIGRLRQTWTRVSNRYRRMFSELESFMDPSRNMSKYRNLINSESCQSPMIPFFPMAKKDLYFHNEGNDDKVDGLINFEKLRTISRSIRELGHMCSARYDPNKMLEQLGQPLNSAMTAMNQGITGGYQISTVKRRKKSTAQPDKKKMFEEAQMVRRVKAYLSQLKVIRDENALLKASYECEPPASGGTSSATTHTVLSTNSSSSSGQVSSTESNSAPPTNPQMRKRPNSPTPSTASSASSTSHTSDGKKPHTRFGSVISQDCHGSQGETDSGISTQFDCHSSSSLEVELSASIPYDSHYLSSPHNPQRRFSHQPEATFRLAPPHAIPVLPPIPPDAVCSGRLARRGTGGVPPDYNSTQMRFQQMGRALSHDGVHYYHYARHEEDDDEGRVSAV